MNEDRKIYYEELEVEVSDFVDSHMGSFNIEKYKILGKIRGESIAYLNIVRFKDEVEDDFWFESKDGIIVPRSVVVYRLTAITLRGRGISGILTEKSNEWSKKHFGVTLSSDSSFSYRNEGYDAEKRYHPKPGMRVWEKLENEGKARYIGSFKFPRWQMN
jgi:hypothetical protein